MLQSTQQLEMVRHCGDRFRAPEPADGYVLRQYEERDRASYWGLFGDVFSTHSRLDNLRTAALPGGFFVVEHLESTKVVASAVAANYPRAGHEEQGSLQWVMADPAHTGKGLGTTVVAAATARLSSGGYRRVYLSTDDWRLPAISVYLKLGWKPLLFAPDMEARWNGVFNGLKRKPAEGDFIVEPR